MYDAEYIRELTAARKANEVARALIADHERTIVAQRVELDALRAELETERQRAAHAEQWEKKNSELIDALEVKIAHLREHVDAFVRSRAYVEATHDD